MYAAPACEIWTSRSIAQSSGTAKAILFMITSSVAKINEKYEFSTVARQYTDDDIAFSGHHLLSPGVRFEKCNYQILCQAECSGGQIIRDWL
jgi:hypothetical protein